MNQKLSAKRLYISKKFDERMSVSLQKLRQQGQQLKKMIKSSSLKQIPSVKNKTETQHPSKNYFSKASYFMTQNKFPQLKNIQKKSKSSLKLQKLSAPKQQNSFSQVNLKNKNSALLLEKRQNLKIKTESLDKSQTQSYKNAKKYDIDIKKSDKKSKSREKSIKNWDKSIKPVECNLKKPTKQYFLPKNKLQLKIGSITSAKKIVSAEGFIQIQDQITMARRHKIPTLEDQQNLRTLSSQGVLICQNRKFQFLKIQNYQNLLICFEKLKQNFFFKHFKISKYLRLWKCYIKFKNRALTIKNLARKHQFSENYINFLLLCKKLILKSVNQQQQSYQLLSSQVHYQSAVAIEKYKTFIYNKIDTILIKVKNTIFTEIVCALIKKIRTQISDQIQQENNQRQKNYGHDKRNKIYQGTNNSSKASHQVIYEMNKQLMKKVLYMAQQERVNLFMRLIQQICRKLNKNYQNYINLFCETQNDMLLKQINKITDYYESILIIQQQTRFSKISLAIKDHDLKITPFQIKLKFNTDTLKFQQYQQDTQLKVTLIFDQIIQNIISYLSKKYDRIYDCQIMSKEKKKHNLIQIMIDVIRKYAISQKQYNVIEEVYNSIDEYKFQNLIQKYADYIQSIKSKIRQKITMNYNSAKLLKLQLQKVSLLILTDLLQSKQKIVASEYYLLLNKGLKILTLMPNYLVIGNFVIICQQANKRIKQYVLGIKKNVVNQTPIIFHGQIKLLETMFIDFNQNIQLSTWALQSFLHSYKKLVQFKDKQFFIQTNKLPRIKNYLSLIHKTNPKVYEQCFLRFIQIQGIFNNLKQKKCKFENKMNSKIRHIVPQKQMLIKATQRQIQKLEKQVIAITQSQNKAFDEILSQMKVIEGVLLQKQIIIDDLAKFQNLQVNHCVKSKYSTHFFSFQKLKKQVQYLIKLIYSQMNFKLQIQSQMTKNYMQFRIDHFADLIQRQTLKIKHGNRILYQYEKFTINSFTYYQKYYSFLQILKIIKILNEEELKSIENGKYFNTFQVKHTAQQIFNFQLQTKYSYLQYLLQKKQFKQNFVKIIHLLNEQIKSIKFQANLEQRCQEQIFKNLDDLKVYIQNIQDKIQMLKSNFDIQPKNTIIIDDAIQKSSKSLKIIIALIQLQTLYINLKYLKGSWATEQLIEQLQKQNINYSTKHIQSNQQQWKKLIQNYKNAFIQCIVEYNYQKQLKLLSVFKLNVQKQISILRHYFQKKRDEFPYLYLFKDQQIISLALSPFNFYTMFYSFVYKASLTIEDTNFMANFQTIYGQNLNIPIQKYDSQVQQQYSHNINLNLSLNQIHSDLKKLIQATLFQFIQFYQQKNYKNCEPNVLLSIVYIVDQYKSIQSFKKFINLENSIQWINRIIQEQIEDTVKTFFNANGNSLYQSHLYSTILLSKLQQRNKLEYMNQDRLFNFFTYSIRQKKMYLNCYGMTLDLSFNLVQVQHIVLLQPITDKIMLNLFNCFHQMSIGIIKQRNSIKNISARVLQDHFIFQKQQCFNIQNILKIASQQSIIFIVSKQCFIEELKYHQFIKKIAGLIIQIKYNLYNCKNKNNQQKLDIQEKNYINQTPKIFIQSFLKFNKLQFQHFNQRQIRPISLCLPSFYYLFDLQQIKSGIPIPKSLSDQIKIRIKILQQKSLEKQYVYSIKDYRNILNNLLQMFKNNEDFQMQSIEEYFKSIQDQQPQLHNKSTKNKQRKNRRSIQKKKKIFKDEKANYFQLIQLFNSIKKSMKLVQAYKQFHECFNSTQKPIMLLGKTFSGKTTFYNKYLQFLNKYPLSQKKINDKQTKIQKYEINCFILSLQQNLWVSDFQNIKALIQNSSSVNRLMIVLKVKNNFIPHQIQQLISKRRITNRDETILLSSSNIVIEANFGCCLSPSLILQSKIITFTQKILQWEEIFIQRSQKIVSSRIFQNDYTNLNQQINLQNNESKANPLQIMCLVLSDIFQQCIKKNYFQISFSDKYLITCVFNLLECILQENEQKLQKQYSQISQTDKKQSLIKKLFIYSFYWTCFWIVHQSMLKHFDISFRDCLSKHDVNVRQIKFYNLIKIDQEKIQYYHIKTLSPNYSNVQALDTYTMYVETYQTQTYKHFLSLACRKKLNLTIFGNLQIGKTSLVKSWLKQNSKRSFTISLKNYQSFVQLNKKLNQMKQLSQIQKIKSTKIYDKKIIKKVNFLNKTISFNQQYRCIFIDQMSLDTNQKYQDMIQWLSQSRSYISDKNYQTIQGGVIYIVQRQFWQVQKNPSLAYRSYPIQIKFQQSYWQNVFQLIFQTIIKNKIVNQDESNLLLKSRSSLVKNLLKFYKGLDKINSHHSKFKTFLTVNKPLQTYTMSQLKLTVSNLIKFNLKQSKQLLSYLQYSVQNNLKSRLYDLSEIQAFQNCVSRFKLLLQDQMALKFTEQSFNSGQSKLFSNKKHFLINDIQDSLMKKLQYQSNNKKMYISNEMMQNLQKIKYGFNNNQFTICNKVLMNQLVQFPIFAAQWFNYQIDTIRSLSELQQKLFRKDKVFKFKDQLTKESQNFQHLKRTNKNQAKSKTYIYFFPFSKKSKQLIQYFFRTINQFSSNKRKNIQAIIQYSDSSDDMIDFLVDSKISRESQIIYLKVDSQQSKRLKFQKMIFKSEKFDGDQKNARHIMQIFIQIYTSVLRNLIQSDIYTYISSNEHFQRMCSTFIQVYFNKKVQFTSLINLISSGVGQFQNIKQQYSYKKNTLRELKRKVQILKIKQQTVIQQKNNLQQNIKGYFNSQLYQSKIKKQQQIIKNKQRQNNLLTQKTHLKKQAGHFHTQINRNELAELKYLFMNSFQSYKQLFQAISLLVSSEQDLEFSIIKKIILDINLMQKLKDLDYSKKNLQLINLVSQKISKVINQNQQKLAATNVSQWIYYSSLYELASVKYVQQLHQISNASQKLNSQIAKIDVQVAIQQKKKSIKTLIYSIQSYNEQIMSISADIKQHQNLLKLQPQIILILQFQQQACKVKQKAKFTFQILLSESLYISFYIHFVLILNYEQNMQNTSKKYENIIIDQIYKKAFSQKLFTEQKLKQQFQYSVESYIDFYIQKKVQVFADQSFERRKGRLKTKNKTKIIIQENQQQKQWLTTLQKQINWMTKDRQKKLKIINYLIQKSSEQFIIVIDPRNQLLNLFKVIQMKKILIVSNINIGKQKSDNNGQSNLKGYYFEQEKKPNNRFITGYLFIQVNSQIWNISMVMTKTSTKKYQIFFKINQFKYSLLLQVSKNCERLNTIFLKDKLTNLSEFTNKFHILSLQNNNLHQKQLIQKQILNWFIKSEKFSQIFNQKDIYQKDLKQRDIQDQLNKFISGDFVQENIFKKKFQCSKDMQNIFKILFNSKNSLNLGQQKFSLFNQQYVNQIYTSVLLWKEKFDYIVQREASFKLVNQFFNCHFKEVQNKLVQIYQLYQFNLRINQSQTKKKIINVHKQMYFDFFLSIISEAFRYLNFKLQKQHSIKLRQNQNSKIEESLKIEQSLKIVQYYLLYQLWSEPKGYLLFALIYLKIYCLQNSQGSLIDIKNLFFSLGLQEHILSFLNSKIGYHHIQIFHKYPIFKLQFEIFVKKYLKMIFVNHRLIGNDEQVNDFIENLTFQNRLVKNSQTEAEFNLIQNIEKIKLSRLSKLLIKKQLIPQYFQRDLKKICSELLQKCEQNLTFYNQFHKQNILVCFCDIQYWIVQINCMFKYLEKVYEIIKIDRNPDFLSINNQIVKNVNSNKPILIFDLRFIDKKSKTQNLQSEQQQQKNISMFVLDIFNIHRKNCTILTHQSFHQYFHHYQTSYKLLNKVGCIPIDQLLLNLLRKSMKETYKHQMQQTRKSNNQLMTAKQIIRRSTQQNEDQGASRRSFINKIKKQKNSKFYHQLKQSYAIYIYRNNQSILKENFACSLQKLQNFIYLKSKIQEYEIDQFKDDLKIQTFLTKHHFQISHQKIFQFSEIGQVNFDYQKNHQELYNKKEWSDIDSNKFNKLFDKNKKYSQKYILSLLGSILKSKLKLNSYLKQNYGNRLKKQATLNNNEDLKTQYNLKKELKGQLTSIVQNTQNQLMGAYENGGLKKQTYIRNSSQQFLQQAQNQLHKQKNDILKANLLNKAFIYQRQEGLLVQAINQSYNAIKQLDTAKRKYANSAELAHYKQKYNINGQNMIDNVIIGQCEHFLSLLKLISYIKLCKSTYNYFIKDYSLNLNSSIQIPLYTFNQKYFTKQNLLKHQFDKLRQILISSNSLSSNISSFPVLKCMKQSYLADSNNDCSCNFNINQFNIIGNIQIKRKIYLIVISSKTKSLQAKKIAEDNVSPFKNMRRRTKISNFSPIINYRYSSGNNWLLKIQMKNIQFLALIQCPQLRSKLLNIQT